MIRPTAQDVRNLTPAPPNGTDYGALGFPVPIAPDPDPLQPLVDAAIQYVEQVTGRVPIESVPDNMAALAQMAIRMRTEQFLWLLSADFVESAADSEVVSFSAGSYSETRRSDRGRKQGEWWINPWGALDELLWLLMTPEKKVEWDEKIKGIVAPAFAVVSPDWDQFSVGDFPSGGPGLDADLAWPWYSIHPTVAELRGGG